MYGVLRRGAVAKGCGQELSLHDDQYGQVSVKSWDGLHPRLICRGRFEGFAKPPVIKCHLVRVTVTRLPNGRKAPGPLWLWWAGPGVNGPGPHLARLPAPLRHRAHVPLPETAARLDPSETPRTRSRLSLIHISEPTRLGMISYAV